MYTTYCLIVHVYVYLLIIMHLVHSSTVYLWWLIDVLCFAVLNRPRPGFQTSLRLSRNARRMVKLIEETWGSLFSYRLFWRPLKPFWVEIMLRRWGPLPIFGLKVHPLRLNTMCRWSLQVASARRELKAMSWHDNDPVAEIDTVSCLRFAVWTHRHFLASWMEGMVADGDSPVETLFSASQLA